MIPQIHPNQPDLICLSHLRWNFVFQRPQHLMSRFAADRRVFFIEEPVFDCTEPRLQTAICRRTQAVRYSAVITSLGRCSRRASCQPLL
jgi:ribonuclease BN (tRNA processing enzyme)